MRRSERPRLGLLVHGALALAILVLGLTTSGCAGAGGVSRMVDGEIVDGPYVSEGEYADRFVSELASAKRASAPRTVDESREREIELALRSGDVSTARSMAARSASREGTKSSLIWVLAAEERIVLGDADGALSFALRGRVKLDEIAARWFLLRGERAPDSLLALASARSDRTVPTYGEDPLPPLPPTGAAGRLALSIFIARRTAVRGALVESHDCPQKSVDPTLVDACVRVRDEFGH